MNHSHFGTSASEQHESTTHFMVAELRSRTPLLAWKPVFFCCHVHRGTATADGRDGVTTPADGTDATTDRWSSWAVSTTTGGCSVGCRPERFEHECGGPAALWEAGTLERRGQKLEGCSFMIFWNEQERTGERVTQLSAPSSILTKPDTVDSCITCWFSRSLDAQLT